MNDLIVKNVSFCGAELLAVKEKDTEKIYVGINSILRELGFDERQIEYQRNKWNNDKVLAKGIQKFLYPSEKGAPIYIWNDFIVGGHNRYELCKKHNIECPIEELLLGDNTTIIDIMEWRPIRN